MNSLANICAYGTIAMAMLLTIGMNAFLDSEDESEDAITSTRLEPPPSTNLHPAVAAGVVDFLETAEAVGAAAEAYENPDGDGASYHVDVPLGHVYEEALPNFVLAP